MQFANIAHKGDGQRRRSQTRGRTNRDRNFDEAYGREVAGKGTDRWQTGSIPHRANASHRRTCPQ